MIPQASVVQPARLRIRGPVSARRRSEDEHERSRGRSSTSSPGAHRTGRCRRKGDSAGHGDGRHEHSSRRSRRVHRRDVHSRAELVGSGRGAPFRRKRSMTSSRRWSSRRSTRSLEILRPREPGHPSSRTAARNAAPWCSCARPERSGPAARVSHGPIGAPGPTPAHRRAPRRDDRHISRLAVARRSDRAFTSSLSRRTISVVLRISASLRAAPMVEAIRVSCRRHRLRSLLAAQLLQLTPMLSSCIMTS
jgi:hypothetical protein